MEEPNEIAAAVAAAVSASNCLRLREALGTAMRLRVMEFRGRKVVSVDKELKKDDLRIMARSVRIRRLVVAVVVAIVQVCVFLVVVMLVLSEMLCLCVFQTDRYGIRGRFLV